MYIYTSAGLTLEQNKHVFRASRDKGAPQKSGHKVIYFISQILGSKRHQKHLKKKVGTMK
jgi:hypothetical protein